MKLLAHERRLEHEPVVQPKAVTVAILVLLPLTLALTIIAYGGSTLPGDVAASRWVQQLGLPGDEVVEQIGYWLGSLPGIVVATAVAVAVLGAARHFIEALLVAAIAFARVLNPLLKWLIESPRPTEEQIRVTEIATNYGFPSGHVMGAALVFGGFIYVAQLLIPYGWLRLLVQGLSVIAILITVFARIYSGAHWLSDAVGGLLWGALVLLVLIRIYQAVSIPRMYGSATDRPDSRRYRQVSN